MRMCAMFCTLLADRVRAGCAAHGVRPQEAEGGVHEEVPGADQATHGDAGEGAGPRYAAGGAATCCGEFQFAATTVKRLPLSGWARLLLSEDRQKFTEADTAGTQLAEGRPVPDHAAGVTGVCRGGGRECAPALSDGGGMRICAMCPCMVNENCTTTCGWWRGMRICDLCRTPYLHSTTFNLHSTTSSGARAGPHKVGVGGVRICAFIKQ